MCFECSRNCASELAALPQAHECAALRVSSRGVRNGGGLDWDSVERDWGSRRLASCFACCLQANCSQSCAPLYGALPSPSASQSQSLSASGGVGAGVGRACPARECVASPALQMRVRPAFPSRPSDFYCHVEPNRNQLLYRFSFQLLFREQPLGPVQTAHLQLSPPTAASSPSSRSDAPLSFRTQHLFLTATYSSGISKVRYTYCTIVRAILCTSRCTFSRFCHHEI